jgi:hypothetical protein
MAGSMMLYSKNGSIPKPQTDGTEGWIEVTDKPTAPEGHEVVWWYPPGWVVRPACPNAPGMSYNWSQSEQKWVASPVEEIMQVVELETSSTPEDVVTFGSAAEVITFGSSGSI